MNDLQKGALYAALIGAIGFLLRSGWLWVQGLLHKIKELKSEKESRFEKRLDEVSQQLTANILINQELKLRIEDLKALIPLVDKTVRDIHALHMWRRMKFPDGNGGGGGDDNGGGSETEAGGFS